MLAGLVERRAECLPHLEKIIFESVDTYDAPNIAAVLQEQCGGVGIELVLGALKTSPYSP